LSARTFHALENAASGKQQPLTISWLTAKSETELEEIERLGTKGINEIKEKLAKYDRSLRSAATADKKQGESPEANLANGNETHQEAGLASGAKFAPGGKRGRPRSGYCHKTG